MRSPPEPKTIQKLVDVYPSFALLAGMQLDLFTPLKAGPMRPEQIAKAIGVGVDKLKPLLYALVAAELLTVEKNRFANTDEANHFLVRGSPSYMGGIHPLYADLWMQHFKQRNLSVLGSHKRSTTTRRCPAKH